MFIIYVITIINESLTYSFDWLITITWLIIKIISPIYIFYLCKFYLLVKLHYYWSKSKSFFLL